MTHHPIEISLEKTSRLYVCVMGWAVQEGLSNHETWLGETDEWHVTFRRGRNMFDGREVNSFQLAHKRLFAVAVVDARGGAVGGADEADLIAHFHGLLTERLFPEGGGANV